MRSVPRLLLAVAAITTLTAAHADEIYDLDAVRSRAEFDVKVMWLVGVRGEFGAVQGTLTVDRFHGTAKVDADIDTNNLHMRTHGYETWAKSGEFFDSEHFPIIHFSSDAFPLDRLARGGAIEGMLTLRGVERPMHLQIAEADCADPLHGACPVDAYGSIHRSEFGMQSRRGALSDKVQLRLSAFVRIEPAKARP